MSQRKRFNRSNVAEHYFKIMLNVAEQVCFDFRVLSCLFAAHLLACSCTPFIHYYSFLSVAVLCTSNPFLPWDFGALGHTTVE